MRDLPIPAPEEKFLPTKIRDWAIIATISASIFAVTVGAYSYFHRPTRVAAPVPSTVAPQPYENLHLRIERAGNTLHLLWDQNAPSVRAATHAVLHITDGPYTTERNLSGALLWAGSFTYQPKTEEETFQLDVYSDAPGGTGVIQVMNPSPQNSVPAAKPLAAPAPAIPLQAATPAVTPATPAMHATPPVVPEKKEVLPPVPNSAAPAAEEKGVAAPNARLTQPATIEKWRKPAPLATPVSYPVPGPRVEMSAEPVPPSRVSRVVEKIPLVRRLKRPSRVASPIPVYEARPKVQLSSADRPVAPVAVNVKVRVAESGAVLVAEVEDYGDPPNWRLAAAALDAARRWTFEPARVEDAAVPSDVILHFRFTP
jgi:hypothetical protein